MIRPAKSKRLPTPALDARNPRDRIFALHIRVEHGPPAGYTKEKLKSYICSISVCVSAIRSSFSYKCFSFSICSIYNVAIISLLPIGIQYTSKYTHTCKPTSCSFFKCIFVPLPLFAHLASVLQFLLSLALNFLYRRIKL